MYSICPEPVDALRFAPIGRDMPYAVVDADNRLTGIYQNTTSGALQNSYVYDNDNNRIQKKNGTGTVIQSTAYDAKGRAATITTSGVSQNTQLTYDPYDYRIAKSDSQGSKTYLL